MAKRKRGSETSPGPLEGVVTSAETLEEAPATGAVPSGAAAEKAPEEAATAALGVDITVCQCEGPVLQISVYDAKGGPLCEAGKLLKLPLDLPRPKAPTIYWIDAPHHKRRQLVLRPDSPGRLEVGLRRIVRRAGASQAPATDAEKEAAQRHADEVEAAIAAAESKRGQPGFRKSPKPEIPDIRLTARQYVRARGYRWEQCGGFLHDMKAQFGAGAVKVRPEWAKLWDAYQTRPVK